MIIYMFQRGKTKCPECGESVWGLARHMRSRKHGWTEDQCRYAKALLGVKSRKSDNIKDLRPWKKCAVPGCTAMVVRLDSHIKKYHTEERELNAHKLFVTKAINSFKEWLQCIDSGSTSEITNQRCEKQVGISKNHMIFVFIIPE